MAWFRRLFDWRVEALIRNEDGSPVNLSLTEDGKLKTETNINIDSVTATDVTIKDATDGNKKLVVNSDGSLNMQLTGSNAIKGAVQNVTTSGTRVQLPNYPCREVTIIALDSNQGVIYVGSNDVSSTVYGARLKPGDSITIPVNNANLIYIDASVSGEGISYVAV